MPAFEKASQQPIPAPDALRVYHRLMHLYMAAGNAAKAASAAAKMVSAREGLAEWEYQVFLLKALLTDSDWIGKFRRLPTH